MGIKSLVSLFNCSYCSRINPHRCLGTIQATDRPKSPFGVIRSRDVLLYIYIFHKQKLGLILYGDIVEDTGRLGTERGNGSNSRGTCPRS
jgi:hypothetical protein